MTDDSERRTFADRSSSALDRIEALYLKALRATLLLVATVLLLGALVWALVSLTRVLRSQDSVVEAPTTVAASELLDRQSAAAGKTATGGEPARSLRNERQYYDGFVRRYYALYRAKYAPHLRRDDKQLTLGAFDDVTVDTAARLEAIGRGELDFATDRQDLEAYLPVVTEASGSPATTERLARYRTAVKRPVTTQVQRTRTESRRGWDTMSENCAAWYMSPIGCPVTRQVEVPYTQTVKVMRYPDGIASPSVTLKDYQDRYFALLADRRTEHRDAAAEERRDILAGQVTGRIGLYQSMLVVGAFLVLMFFFLLVAIERHLRRRPADDGAGNRSTDPEGDEAEA